jgi:hypothetical protein
MAGTLDNQYHGDGPLGDRSLPRRSSGYIQGSCHKLSLTYAPRKSSGYIQGSTTGADRSEIGPYLTRPSIRPCYVRDRGSTETAKP